MKKKPKLTASLVKGFTAFALREMLRRFPKDNPAKVAEFKRFTKAQHREFERELWKRFNELN